MSGGDDYALGIQEAVDTKDMNTRISKGKTYHLIVSFRPEDEARLTPDVFQAIEVEFARPSGLKITGREGRTRIRLGSGFPSLGDSTGNWNSSRDPVSICLISMKGDGEHPPQRAVLLVAKDVEADNHFFMPQIGLVFIGPEHPVPPRRVEAEVSIHLQAVR